MTALGTKIRKILIVGPSWVGDMVMAQALFIFLKKRYPIAELHVLAAEWTFSLLSCMPEVTHAIKQPFGHGELKIVERYRFAQSLKRYQYDLAIVLPNSFKSALIPWFAGIPRRRGWLGEMRYVVLNEQQRLNKKLYPLMVEQYLALGLEPTEVLPRPYPIPHFSISSLNQQQILNKLNLILEGKPILAIAAGGEFGVSKRWLPEYFATVANQKIREGWSVWLFGSSKDQAINQQIMALTQQACIDFSGQLQLSETITLLSLVSGLISNDSGLMHVAAALKKPLVAIYGSTSPAFTPPLSIDAKVIKRELPCQPCFQRECPLGHHQCMRDISPNEVLNAVLDWRT